MQFTYKEHRSKHYENVTQIGGEFVDNKGRVITDASGDPVKYGGVAAEQLDIDLGGGKVIPVATLCIQTATRGMKVEFAAPEGNTRPLRGLVKRAEEILKQRFGDENVRPMVQPGRSKSDPHTDKRVAFEILNRNNWEEVASALACAEPAFLTETLGEKLVREAQAREAAYAACKLQSDPQSNVQDADYKPSAPIKKIT
ncbi:MAG: hypothetical protein JO089_09300 [Alphaproteobacteria bacterium]|nr:hypothetical protein [Alphaproteobacteria bacterium]